MSRSTLRLDTSSDSIAIAAKILRGGGLVAIPTETVYGLAANALDTAAVADIFKAKQRPGWDPLIVHIAGMDMLPQVAKPLSATAQRLMEAAWPGPLTLLLPRTSDIPDAVTAGRPLVGIRWTAHPIAQALIRAAGVPLAAPSANRFGHISPTTADHVLHDLEGRIDAVIDDGPTAIGLESTVLDPNTNPITIYRQGAFTAEQVEQVTGRSTIVYQPSSQPKPEAMPSPGVGIRHYAPRTPLRLVNTPEELIPATNSIERFSVLLPTGWPAPANGGRVTWADWNDTAALAHRLYAALRELDRMKSELIVAPLPDLRPNDDLRAALRDRLLKAALPTPGERGFSEL